MFDQQDGQVKPVVDEVDQIHQFDDLLWIHAGSRFIQQQQLRVGMPARGQFPPGAADRMAGFWLFHSEYLPVKIARKSMACSVSSFSFTEKFLAAQNAVCQGYNLHADGKRCGHYPARIRFGKQTDILEGPSNSLAGDFEWFHAGNGFTLKHDTCRGWGIEAGDQVENSGLSCAVWSDQARQVTLVQGDIKILHRAQTAKVLGQAFDF